MKTKKELARINFWLSKQDKENMLIEAKKERRSLTQYIINKCVPRERLSTLETH